jgi:hypothetical protein
MWKPQDEESSVICENGILRSRFIKKTNFEVTFLYSEISVLHFAAYFLKYA